jgi:predicted ATPase/class 3 adenylate cyclase
MVRDLGKDKPLELPHSFTIAPLWDTRPLVPGGTTPVGSCIRRRHDASAANVSSDLSSGHSRPSEKQPVHSLPTGTVTFLFADIEGSTRLLQQLGDAYADVLIECRRLIRAAVQERGGREADAEGDGVFAAFPSAREALLAAITAQQSILRNPWPTGAAVRVRMGLHTGEPRVTEVGYVGMDVHRAARISAAAHGGQILISDTTHALVAKDLPVGIRLHDLGEHRLKDLAHPHRLFHLLAADLPASFPPIRSLDILRNNLPRQLTNFIGREKEIAEIKQLLSTAALVTLTGAGGAGKTRLALQVAAAVMEGFADGVWLAEFAPIADPALVPKTVATAVGVPEQPGREIKETLIDALRPKAVLLVLDNCEHLLEACADIAGALLRACPQVRILATSRERLAVPGERLWRVPSLSLPDARHLPAVENLVLYDAIRLFVDRATTIAPEFRVTSEDVPALVQACQRLDGIPLAIELAAARAKVLSVRQITERLDDRFRLLTEGSRTALPRHQTLRAVMDWSYDLLSEQERILLRRLSVFAGGWTLEAAESVCIRHAVETPKVLDLLTQLVDKSLVMVETQGSVAWYRLLETVRQYARDRLTAAGESAGMQTQHRNWYLDLAERAEPELRGPGQSAWLKQLELEHDNLRAALESSIEEHDGAHAGLRLAGALYWFWFVRGHWSEGRRWLEAFLTRSSDVPVPALLKALQGVSFLAYRQGDFKRATAVQEQGLAVARNLCDSRSVALFLITTGLVAMNQGDYGRATVQIEESLALSRQLGDRWLISLALGNLGTVVRHQHDYPQAAALYEQALALSREIGDKRRIAYSLRNLGIVALHRGDYDQARAFFSESLFLIREFLDPFIIEGCVAGMAVLSGARGLHMRAARLLGVAAALCQTFGLHRAPPDQAAHDQQVASTSSALGETAFTAAWAEGSVMTMEEGINYAVAVDA